MTRLKLSLVIGFMTTALIGLIALQVYWISHDIEVKEEQFEQNVSMAMNNVVNKLESQRDINNIIADFFNFDTTSTGLSKLAGNHTLSPALFAQLSEQEGEAFDTMRHSHVHSSIKVFKKNNKEIITFFDNQVVIAPGIDVYKKFRDNFDWDQFQSQDLYYYPLDPSDENLKLHLRKPKTDLPDELKVADSDKTENKSQSFSFEDSATGSEVQVDYSSTVGKNYSINYKSIQRKRDSLLNEFNGIMNDPIGDSARSAILSSREKFEVTIKRYQKLLNKISHELGQGDNVLKSKEDCQQLDTLIKNELLNYSVTLPYKFAVVNTTNDSVLFCSKPVDTIQILKSNIRTQLYPNDIIQKPYMLMIDFPGKLNYVLSNVWPVLISAVIFSLIIIFGFAYTIHVVLRQKKLADIKNDFINNMTHEFKTPIATIALAADSIRNEKVYTDKQKLDFYTTIIKQENTRMNNQVTNVLQMAQMDKGELKLKFEEVNVHDVIQSVIQSNQLQVENRNGVVKFTPQAQQPIISADLTHISNVINNLIDNAIKYSNELLSITINTWNSESGIFIEVTDRGMGMTSETVKHIFEKFYRATTGNLHDVKGFGLGLSYSKAIVDEHRGTIDVKSEKGKGSTFTIYLPFK